MLSRLRLAGGSRLRLAAGLLALVAAGASGCGGDPADSRPPAGDPLSVYLSLPRQGDSAEQAQAVAAGAGLALRDAGGMAGGSRVRLVELDSSDPDDDGLPGGGWDPAAVSRNAERAASDPTAIAYIGELDLGGSAVSVPITNNAGILQVSPGDGLTSLTRELPATGGAGPERYYPSGERNFLRLVPIDFLQASTLVQWARLSGARSLALVHDGSLFGRDLLTEATLVASCEGLRVVDAERVGADATRYPQLADRLAEERPDAVIYAGAAGGIAAPLASALEAELRSLRLFGAGGVANRPTSRAGGPDTSVSTDHGSMLVTRSARPLGSYPDRGRRVLRRLAALRGRPLPTDALYGYEAMSMVLDAIGAAGRSSGSAAPGRAAVRSHALAPRTRRSVLGSYRIGPTGDISESRFAGYRREAGALPFEGIERPGYRLAPPATTPETTDNPCTGLLRRDRESD